MASLDGQAKNIKQNGPQIHMLFFRIFDFRKMQNPNWIFCGKSEKWETEDCIKKEKFPT